jgi:hypothetical protein
VDDHSFALVIAILIFAWVVVIMCLSVGVALIYPFGWFLVPKPKYRRASSKRRPAEPDHLDAEVPLYRWVSFLIMYFFWFMILSYVLAYRGGLEHDSFIPPITISAEGEVVFLELRLPPGDHELESLRVRLRALAPLSNRRAPVLILPAPETEHLRIIEVLSAVDHAGVFESTLL